MAAVPIADLDRALAYLDGVEGWLSKHDATVLFDVATIAIARNPQGVLVEVGSFHGRSTIMLGAAAQPSLWKPQIYAVDPHEGNLSRSKVAPSWSSFIRNLRGAGLLAPDGPVTPIHQRSADVKWSRPISMLFIDGLHDETSVRIDWEKFGSWVVSGGYVAFHDYGNTDFPDVRRVVDGLIAARLLDPWGSLPTPTKENCLFVTRKV